MRDKAVKEVVLNHYAKKLAEIAVMGDRGVSAGRYAEHCGIARSTAHIRLSQLVVACKAHVCYGTHTNKQPARYYSPVCEHAHMHIVEVSTGETYYTCLDCGVSNG